MRPGRAGGRSLGRNRARPHPRTGIFGPLQYGYNFDKKCFSISDEQKHEIISEHFKALCEFKGEYTAVREMRKHLAAYVQGIKGAARLRQKIVVQTSAPEMAALIDGIFS